MILEYEHITPLTLNHKERGKRKDESSDSWKKGGCSETSVQAVKRIDIAHKVAWVCLVYVWMRSALHMNVE
jgi:hypothetical protein